MLIKTDSITNIRTPDFLATIIELSISENKVNPDFQKGYQDASDISWNTMPLTSVVPVIDSYRELALRHGSLYIAGFAQGAWDLLMARRIIS